ncbi:MAG: isoaspartyl peptidase/L-asparaginase [Candidatus Sericytochromatia bacterium]|nr:isoaspartyl peptidase/L-asparaginase [Candidatus Sericytochromatia bacterium]
MSISQPVFQRAILTHGGSSSDPLSADGTLSAARCGMELLQTGQSALAAVVQAVIALEDDPRFNAGTGSRLRADGQTVQMDAACMTSKGEFGSVACIEAIQNPIRVAQAVLLASPCILLVGNGARLFAHEQKIPLLTQSNTLAPHRQAEATPACDTVGAVAYDGVTFAAALSSGGLQGAALGRVGDVPLPGCGLYCGPMGAVACTGDGEFIALKLLAKEVYSWLEQAMPPAEAAAKARALFEPSVDIGLIVLSQKGCAGQSRDGMAWSELVEAD